MASIILPGGRVPAGGSLLRHGESTGLASAWSRFTVREVRRTKAPPAGTGEASRHPTTGSNVILVAFRSRSGRVIYPKVASPPCREGIDLVGIVPAKCLEEPCCVVVSGYPWMEREDVLACLAYVRRVVGHERIEPLLVPTGT
jgi:hypothetical protein